MSGGSFPTSMAWRAPSSGTTRDCFKAPRWRCPRRVPLQKSLVALAAPRLAARPIAEAHVALDGPNRELGGVVRETPSNVGPFCPANGVETRLHLVGVAAAGFHGVGNGRDRSSYGRRSQSKKVHVRFQESRCSGVSRRSSVTGSTRRLKEWPLGGST